MRYIVLIDDKVLMKLQHINTMQGVHKCQGAIRLAYLTFPVYPHLLDWEKKVLVLLNVIITTNIIKIMITFSSKVQGVE